MTSHERLLEVSSRLWDRTQRSCVVRIVAVGNAVFSSHGVSSTVDASVWSAAAQPVIILSTILEDAVVCTL